MAVKLKDNVTHDGVLYRAGVVLSALAEEVEADLLKRGLAEQTNEAPNANATETTKAGVGEVAAPEGAATPTVSNPANQNASEYQPQQPSEPETVQVRQNAKPSAEQIRRDLADI